MIDLYDAVGAHGKLSTGQKTEKKGVLEDGFPMSCRKGGCPFGHSDGSWWESGAMTHRDGRRSRPDGAANEGQGAKGNMS